MVTLNILAFVASSLLLAWCGGYVDAFWIPMDPISARALGASQFAYPTILFVRFGIAFLGSTIFAISYLAYRLKSNREAPRPKPTSALSYGAIYSAAFFLVGELPAVTLGSGVIVGLATVALFTPIFLGRRLAQVESLR